MSNTQYYKLLISLGYSEDEAYYAVQLDIEFNEEEESYSEFMSSRDLSVTDKPMVLTDVQVVQMNNDTEYLLLKY